MSLIEPRGRGRCLAVVACLMGLATSGLPRSLGETIDFTDGSGVNVGGGDLQFSSTGGLVVTAAGYESTILDVFDFIFTDSRQVIQSGMGLGVDGNGVGQSDTEVDGVGINEFLVLDFGTTVELASIGLNNLDSDGSDGIAIFLWGNSTPVFTQDNLPETPPTFNIVFSTPLTGDRFVFGLWGGDTILDPNRRSDYSLASVTTTAVPLPLAAWGGLSLLGLLSADGLRRRRQQLAEIG